MDEAKDGPDTSSIQSISSLRSRFEDLGKNPGGATGTSAKIGRHATGQRAEDKISPESAKPSWHRTAQSSNGLQGLQKPRPYSATSSSNLEPSLPTVTVNPPQSPERYAAVDLKRTTNSTSNTYAIRSHPDHSHKPNGSTASSSTTSPAAPNEGSHTRADVVDRPVATVAKAGVVPPRVNRAAKPKLHRQSPPPASPFERLSAPEPSTDLSDNSLSPFSTPPHSGKSSPDNVHNNESTHPRARSNDSFVDRLNRATRQSPNNSANHAGARARPGAIADPVSVASHTTVGLDRARLPTSTVQLDGGNAANTKHRVVGFESNDETAVPGHRNSGERPRLPVRPELLIRPSQLDGSQRKQPSSLETSPTRQKRSGASRSIDVAGNAARRDNPTSASRLKHDVSGQSSPCTPDISQALTKSLAPAVPPPRRSMDRRPDLSAQPKEVDMPDTRAGTSSRVATPEHADVISSEYPDSSQVNRRPPKYKRRPHRIATEYDTRLVAVASDLVCTSGFITKVWNWRTGELLLNMTHGEGTKITAIAFKPTSRDGEQSQGLWLGSNTGDIHEVNISDQRITRTKGGAHSRREIIRIIRSAADLWTLDEAGELVVWRSDHTGVPSLESPSRAIRVCHGSAIAVACGADLWLAIGREIRIVRPAARTEAERYFLRDAIVQSNIGEITSGTSLSNQPDRIYFGHSDGKISIYDRKTYSCHGVVAVNAYRVSSLLGVGDQLWAGFSTGMVYAYDLRNSPWTVMKEWKAHDKPISAIVLDPTALWNTDLLQVVTLGADNILCLWDGMLQDDWMDSRMHEHDSEYCSFDDLSMALLTWNVGASKPGYLQHSIDDSGFFQDYVRGFVTAPDLFVFGFQELVDLEDKKLTAKSFFKSKKRDPAEPEHMSHQYRAWRDHLTRCLEDYMPRSEPYVLLYTASMVGLFTCIFVRHSARDRVQHVHGTEVKRGMGGLHGNKGALIVRMVVDDSSLCLVNCHLAAGQTSTLHRNNDVAAILESESLPRRPLGSNIDADHTDVFVSGGDGSMILDHEICVLSGDLNYRIDTMGRDTVVKHVESNKLERLLERDQLLLSRRRNPGFRLRAFQESPITFAPTYKYNLRSDVYDTSEKRRSPAWCDRILYRGQGKVRLHDYRRWEVRVSDHRPVSGHLSIRVKKVDASRRARLWDANHRAFDAHRRKVTRAIQLMYLTDTLGFSKTEAQSTMASFP